MGCSHRPGDFFGPKPLFSKSLFLYYFVLLWANAAVFSLYRQEAQHEFIDNFLGWRPFTIRPALTSIEAF
jgi:hypothetical protein